MVIDRESQELRIIYDIGTDKFYRAFVTYYKNEGRPPYEIKIVKNLGRNPSMLHNTECLAVRLDKMKGGEGNEVKQANIYRANYKTLKGE